MPKARSQKSLNTQEEPSYNYKGWGGWLRLFNLWVQAIFPIQSVISVLLTLRAVGTDDRFSAKKDESDVFLSVLLFIYCLLMLFLNVYGFKAGSALYRVQPGAVTLAKNFISGWVALSFFRVVIEFFTLSIQAEKVKNLKVEFGYRVDLAKVDSGLETAVFGQIFAFAIVIIICWAWIAYFNNSRRVKATYAY